MSAETNADGAVFSAEAALEKKIELRRHVLEHVNPARVFEGFCGLGDMWQGAWREEHGARLSTTLNATFESCHSTNAWPACVATT
jgi:hypothetical protein